MSKVEKKEVEVEIKSTAEKFHDVFGFRPHHVNNMTPDKVHGCDLHDGEFGKPGSIVCWSYTHDGEKKVAKQVVEEIDDKNNSTRFRMIEGDLMKDYNHFIITVKATPKGEGSVVTWSLEYERKLPETPHPGTLLEFFAHMTKDIDEHLQKN